MNHLLGHLELGRQNSSKELNIEGSPSFHFFVLFPCRHTDRIHLTRVRDPVHGCASHADRFPWYPAPRPFFLPFHHLRILPSFRRGRERNRNLSSGGWQGLASAWKNDPLPNTSPPVWGRWSWLGHLQIPPRISILGCVRPKYTYLPIDHGKQRVDILLMRVVREYIYDSLDVPRTNILSSKGYVSWV